MRVEGQVIENGLELRFSEAGGYQVATRRLLRSGTSVLQEPALACAVPPQSQLCRKCLAPVPRPLGTAAAPRYTCSRCEQVLYCCSRCLNSHSPLHSRSGECALLRSQAARQGLGGLLREACLALQLVNCPPLTPPLCSNVEVLLGRGNPEGEEQRGALIAAACHAHQAWVQAQDEAQAGTGVAPSSPSKPPPVVELKDVCRALCQVVTNAVEVLNVYPGMEGESDCLPHHSPLAVYRLLSRMNHSCRPNAAYHWGLNTTLLVRLLQDVPAGATVTISYLDPLTPRHQRLPYLASKYQFLCTCPRCHLPDGLAARGHGDDYADGGFEDDLGKGTRDSDWGTCKIDTETSNFGKGTHGEVCHALEAAGGAGNAVTDGVAGGDSDPVHDELPDGRTDGRTKGITDGVTDGGINRGTDRGTDGGTDGGTAGGTDGVTDGTPDRNHNGGSDSYRNGMKPTFHTPADTPNPSAEPVPLPAGWAPSFLTAAQAPPPNCHASPNPDKAVSPISKGASAGVNNSVCPRTKAVITCAQTHSPQPDGLSTRVADGLIYSKAKSPSTGAVHNYPDAAFLHSKANSQLTEHVSPGAQAAPRRSNAVSPRAKALSPHIAYASPLVGASSPLAETTAPAAGGLPPPADFWLTAVAAPLPDQPPGSQDTLWVVRVSGESGISGDADGCMLLVAAPETGPLFVVSPSQVSPSQREACWEHMVQVEALMQGVLKEAEQQLLGQRDACGCLSSTPPCVLAAQDSGLHPFHHLSLQAYALLASAAVECALNRGADAEHTPNTHYDNKHAPSTGRNATHTPNPPHNTTHELNMCDNATHGPDKPYGAVCVAEAGLISEHKRLGHGKDHRMEADCRASKRRRIDGPHGDAKETAEEHGLQGDGGMFGEEAAGMKKTGREDHLQGECFRPKEATTGATETGKGGRQQGGLSMPEEVGAGVNSNKSGPAAKDGCFSSIHHSGQPAFAGHPCGNDSKCVGVGVVWGSAMAYSCLSALAVEWLVQSGETGALPAAAKAWSIAGHIVCVALKELRGKLPSAARAQPGLVSSALQATLNQATPNQATPNQATPNQATLSQATLNQATLSQAIPNQATPNQASDAGHGKVSLDLTAASQQPVSHPLLSAGEPPANHAHVPNFADVRGTGNTRRLLQAHSQHGTVDTQDSKLASECANTQPGELQIERGAAEMHGTVKVGTGGDAELSAMGVDLAAQNGASVIRHRCDRAQQRKELGEGVMDQGQGSRDPAKEQEQAAPAEQGQQEGCRTVTQTRAATAGRQAAEEGRKNIVLRRPSSLETVGAVEGVAEQAGPAGGADKEQGDRNAEGYPTSPSPNPDNKPENPANLSRKLANQLENTADPKEIRGARGCMYMQVLQQDYAGSAHTSCSMGVWSQAAPVLAEELRARVVSVWKVAQQLMGGVLCCIEGKVPLLQGASTASKSTAIAVDPQGVLPKGADTIPAGEARLPMLEGGGGVSAGAAKAASHAGAHIGGDAGSPWIRNSTVRQKWQEWVAASFGASWDLDVNSPVLSSGPEGVHVDPAQCVLLCYAGTSQAFDPSASRNHIGQLGQALAESCVLFLAHSLRLHEMMYGNASSLTEMCAFLPFTAQLPMPQAAVITAAVNAVKTGLGPVWPTPAAE